MNASPIYIAIALAALAVIALLVFLAGKNRRENKLTPLASIAFAFVLAGILFADNRLIGYGLIGIGILLAVVDIFNKSRKR